MNNLKFDLGNKEFSLKGYKKRLNREGKGIKKCFFLLLRTQCVKKANKRYFILFLKAQIA